MELVDVGLSPAGRAAVLVPLRVQEPVVQDAAAVTRFARDVPDGVGDIAEVGRFGIRVPPGRRRPLRTGRLTSWLVTHEAGLPPQPEYQKIGTNCMPAALALASSWSSSLKLKLPWVGSTTFQDMSISAEFRPFACNAAKLDSDQAVPLLSKSSWVDQIGVTGAAGAALAAVTPPSASVTASRPTNRFMVSPFLPGAATAWQCRKVCDRPRTSVKTDRSCPVQKTGPRATPNRRAPRSETSLVD